jgi:hypothetical protein
MYAAQASFRPSRQIVAQHILNRRRDLIFIVGFSRGSCTARALDGLIVDQGLLNANTLDLTDPLVAYRNGIAAWRAHRANRVSAIAKPGTLRFARCSETWRVS